MFTSHCQSQQCKKVFRETEVKEAAVIGILKVKEAVIGSQKENKAAANHSRHQNQKNIIRETKERRKDSIRAEGKR
jgi:hypothetical protein